MINYLIFSKDRACQLDLLLRSMHKHLFDFRTTVLFTYSNHKYQSGYEALIEKYSQIHFIKETNFREDTRDIVTFTKNNIGFACDDNVIFAKQPSSIPTLNFGECFSLRLGLNTVVQNIYNNQYQPPLEKYIRQQDIISWNILKLNPTDNYGYPFSLDFHIYNPLQILLLINTFPWKNTNELEGGLFKYRNRMIYMQAFQHSISVNIPINNMSGYTQSGKWYQYSNEELNEKFLQGYTIDLEEIEKTKIIGCHQEIPFVFRKV